MQRSFLLFEIVHVPCCGHYTGEVNKKQEGRLLQEKPFTADDIKQRFGERRDAGFVSPAGRIFAALSFFNTQTQGSGFFYDEVFGIEGSWMAILVNIAACVIVVLIGRHMRRRQAA